VEKARHSEPDDHGCVGREDVEPRLGVNTRAEDLEEPSRWSRDRLGHWVQLGLVDGDSLREAAVKIAAKEGSVPAEVRTPRPAQLAVAARDRWIDKDSRALGHDPARTGPDYSPDQLVTKDARVRDRNFALRDLDVGAADANELEPNERLSGRVGLLDLGRNDGSGRGEDDRLHGDRRSGVSPIDDDRGPTDRVNRMSAWNARRRAGVRPKVFIVQPVPEEALTELRAVADVEMFGALDRTITRRELQRGVRSCEYLWVLGEIPVDAEILDGAELKLIAIMEILSRSVDIAAATARGIPVTTLPNLDAVTTSTAEHTLGLLVALARRLPQAERLLREGRWAQYQSMALLGTRLAGKTLGIVGLGNVGRRLARYAVGLGMVIRYTDRARLPEAEQQLGVEWRELDELFRESDFIALTPTLTASSRGLVGRRLLESMKRDAFLVNTSRGPVVDEAALVDVLREKRIAGAALDVFETEPPTVGGGPHPGLLELENVILTPHLGTATRESRTEMARIVASGVVAAIEGRRPPYVTNPEVYGETAGPVLDRIG